MPRPRRENVLRETFVERIYNSLLATLEQGVAIEDAVQKFIPMLLNEIDALSITYPEIQEIFKDTLEKMWMRWFRDIPLPPISHEDSSVTVFQKVLQTLMEHREKLVSETYVIVSEAEERRMVEYTAASFMEAVCRRVFKLYGVLR